jgi:far upstream element-binding protein
MGGGMGGGAETTDTVECPQGLVGKVIGRGGETIKDLQARSGCRIQINQALPEGQPRLITITGTPDAVPIAFQLVKEVMDSAPGSAMGGGAGAHSGASGAMGGASQVVDCDPGLVGRVIGRGGETIRDLQARSGARVQIDQNFPAGQPRKITITGTPETVQLAVRLLNDVMENGPNSGSGGGGGGGGPPQDGSVQEIIACEKAMVGRIIGHKGETINELQQRSGCRIQIDQNVPDHEPRKIIISGTMENVPKGVAAVQDCMTNGPVSSACIDLA